MKNLSASVFFLLLALAAQLASAQTIRRVNNSGITGTNIYADLTAAQTAASNGDIIQVEPSTTQYPAFSCSKQLTIVGPGYFLGENQPPALQANTITANVSTITFAPGSAGSTISGIESNTTWYINANNITVQRCKLTGYIYLAYGSNTSGAVIRQNYFYGVQESSISTNSLITNNIIYNSTSINAVGASGEFSNNSVIGGGTSLNNFTVRNNYFASTFTPTANTNWDYNFFAQTTLPTLGTIGTHNTANVPQASIFVLAPTAPGQFDAWYKLKAGTNPAVGAGQGGVDIGATGSATGYGYHFGGLPAIPSIYQLNQAVTGNTLNVTLGTRSNN
ncbi:hypothetical protein [Hymenobacter properus]|uniref:Right-handed parallel beta-helix repeat-containing protein n=1 Tax=Hymenobacter properus TaxID=2791026 RepID=A0A931BNN9_9BACT|nr:hypothetical protein [Hymenobacter properus]MBF9143628.1 hypothetical protein [Hymenobacter properus]MBR7722441.1 hypothetical protein [Microvirga sp. SRT04]